MPAKKRGLTIHSSRSRFAARLNSGVTPQMRHLLAIALLTPLLVLAHQKNGRELIGYFSSLDWDAQSCGVLAVGSKATFVVDDAKEVSIVVPCIEMQTIKTHSGEVAPLELQRMYRILVSPDRPDGMNLPAPSPELLYLIETHDADAPAP